MDNKNTQPNNANGGRQSYGGRPGFGGRPNFANRNQQGSDQQGEYFEKVVQVNRVSKKTKGGNKRGLSVIVVAGDRKGKVGVGLGKAADVQSAVRKASAYAKKHMIEVHLKDGRTIPHNVYVKLGAAKVLLKGAPEGTGVIAGGAVRVVVEAAGIRDIVSKTLGTTNQASNVYATLQALTKLKPAREESKVKTDETKKTEEKKTDKKED